jgi:hypothetical protein
VAPAAMVGQVSEQRPGLLRPEPADDPVTLARAQPAEQLDPPRFRHHRPLPIAAIAQRAPDAIASQHIRRLSQHSLQPEWISAGSDRVDSPRSAAAIQSGRANRHHPRWRQSGRFPVQAAVTDGERIGNASCRDSLKRERLLATGEARAAPAKRCQPGSTRRAVETALTTRRREEEGVKPDSVLLCFVLKVGTSTRMRFTRSAQPGGSKERRAVQARLTRLEAAPAASAPGQSRLFR